jgi:hypothetical protein
VVTKLPHRERHFAEYVAGIILLHGSAFLFGNAVLGCLHQILGRTYDANHREDTKRNGQITSAVTLVKIKGRIKSSAYRFGKITFLTTATAVTLGNLFHDPGAKNHGIHNLYDCGGNVSLTARGVGRRAKAITLGVTLENVDVALATVKDHPLLQHGNALQLLGTSTTNTSFQAKLYIKANGNRIKASVELDRIQADLCPNDLGALGANGARMLQNLISVSRKIHASLLKAIAVTAGI